MASRKKAPEGIALLSMYNDEDDEMDDADGEKEEEDKLSVESSRGDDSHHTDLSAHLDSALDNTPQIANEDSTPKFIQDGMRWTPQQSQPPQSPPPPRELQQESPKNRKAKLSIVDYGHDEAALSPEAEEGEIERNELEMVNGDFHNFNVDSLEKVYLETIETLVPGVRATSQSSEHLDLSHSDAKIVDAAATELEINVVIGAAKTFAAAAEEVNYLETFLPPPPKAKCSDDLQEKINKFLAYKKHGKSFNAEVRNRKDYRNPDFLLHAVRYQDIDQIGSCFSKDVFDPHGYDKSDYYDEIEADMKREMEKKEQERKKNQKVDFVAGGAQSGSVTAAAKVNLPPQGSGGLLPVPPASDSATRESRHSKKSKWDKVDGERQNPVLPGGQDSSSTVGAHTAILSAANAGAGYTAFAQQRRREAEEKRSGGKRSERSS